MIQTTNIKAGVGLSTEKDPLKAAQEAVRQARLGTHIEKVDLAFVFSSIEFAHSTTLKTIGRLLGSVPVIGCSSLAVISNQGIFKHGLTVLLLSIPENIFFNASCVKDIGAKTTVSSGDELAKNLLYGFKNVRRDLSVTFSDGLIRDGYGLLYGMQERLGRSFPLIGGSASDNLTFTKTYIYSGEEVFSDGASGVLFGGKLNFGLGAKHGWEPLGKPRFVTKSSGNIVYEIDNAPAVEIYKDYLAADIAKLKKELKRITILYPIGLYIPGEEEYLLRNMLSIEENGALVFQGDVPQESQIRLMIGTKESCLAATHQALEEAKRGLSGHPINFVFVFDSISRYSLLGRDAKKELDIIKAGLDKDTPIIGIYTYGEQAPLKAVNYQGRSYFHNQTIAILAIGG